jgi:hypothetical protein
MESVHITQMLETIRRNRNLLRDKLIFGKFSSAKDSKKTHSNKPKFKELSDADYKIWKENYLIEKKNENRKSIIRISIVLFISGLIFTSTYLWSTDELQFIGQETEYCKAKVIKTNMHHIGRGFYMQTVKYEYAYNGQKYLDEFEVGIITGKQQIGGVIKIKVSKSFPHLSKYIETY